MTEQKFSAAAAALVSALVYVEYDQFVKKLDSPKMSQKILYLIIDAIHIIVMLSCLFLGYYIVTKKNSQTELIFLNTLWFVTVLLFLHYKRCILTLMAGDVLEMDILFINPIYRLNYILGYETEYENIHYLKPNDDATGKWMKGNQLPICLVILLNLYFVSKK